MFLPLTLSEVVRVDAKKMTKNRLINFQILPKHEFGMEESTRFDPEEMSMWPLLALLHGP